MPRTKTQEPRLKLTEAEYDSFIDTNRNGCPKCLSDNTRTVGEPMEGFGAISCKVECLSCGAKWAERYELEELLDVEIVPNERILDLRGFGITITCGGKGGGSVLGQLHGYPTDDELQTPDAAELIRLNRRAAALDAVTTMLVVLASKGVTDPMLPSTLNGIIATTLQMIRETE